MIKTNLSYYENWIVQARKGLLELMILNRLNKKGECYGYELVKELIAIPGSGLSEGTVYPLLSRLRVQGLVKTSLKESDEGPARKYYSLTGSGEETLNLMNEYWKTLISAE
ncbi:MAG TPA: PadR family transcriptional regulator [Lentisphaeria bacterium]|nr:MAG: hypothetical protein A2X45_15495 [Lentisphaerae bacterium GWF2_50_93]HCE46007.1 PadR family transcriptional regulator [Lentisphaeria bacterium]